jgi:hypothetical protein
MIKEDKRGCGRCYNKGYIYVTVSGTEDEYIPDFDEMYCYCSAAMKLRIRDGAPK